MAPKRADTQNARLTQKKRAISSTKKRKTFLYLAGLVSAKKRGELMGLLKFLLVPLLRLFVRETKGFNRIPKKGPAILVANHMSYIDGPLILYLTDWHVNRWARSIQSREYYMSNWFTRFFYGIIFKAIPVNGSVRKALEALRNNELLLLFPEGGRSADGKLQKATHTGLGVLASLSKAPVVPIGIEGSYDWWPRHRKLPTFKPKSMVVRVGKPVRYTGKPARQNHLTFQHKIMHTIARLARTTYAY